MRWEATVATVDAIGSREAVQRADPAAATWEEVSILRKPQVLLLSAAAVALAITSLGAPAVAAPGKGTISFVNGAPGRSVDVCINGREVRSGMRYGQKAHRTFWAGRKNIKFYARNRRVCRGVLLGRKTIDLQPDQHQTAVVTRKSPKRVVVFSSIVPVASRPSAPAVFGYLRHAADVGAAYLEWELHNINTNPVEPALVSPFVKGDSSSVLLVYAEDPALVILRAFRPLAASPFLKPSIHRIDLLREYEWILVGTNLRNARFIQLSQPISFS